MADPHCQRIGTCGWGCLEPHGVFGACLDLDSHRRSDRILSAAQANLAWRLAKLTHIAYTLALIVPCFNSKAQLRRWVWYISDQRRLARLAVIDALTANGGEDDDHPQEANGPA